MGSADSDLSRLASAWTGCVAVNMWTLGPIWTSSPIVTRGDIQDDEPEVRECSSPDGRLVAVVAPERRPDLTAFAEVGSIVLSRCVSRVARLRSRASSGSWAL